MVHPTHDEATQRSSCWANEALAAIQPTLDLSGPQAVESQVQSALKHPCKLVLFYGHGDSNSWIGHDWSPAIRVASASRLRGAIVHAVACYTGGRLSRAAIQAGALAYVGYTGVFELFEDSADDRWVSGATAIITEELARGGTVQDAVDASISVYEAAIAFYQQQWEAGADIDAIANIGVLTSIRDQMVVMGNATATL